MHEGKKILIIGMSKMGKTHFGAQLFGRLKNGQNAFKLGKTPGDLSLFQDVLDNLNEGLPGKHTDVRLHETIILPIVSPHGAALELVYPDYGGEQLRHIIEQRKVNVSWRRQIEESTHWFLFIRLDMIEKISDVTQKFYQQIDGESEARVPTAENITDLKTETSAFYVELMQAFLYFKGIQRSQKGKPRLTVLLSCWDRPGIATQAIPAAVLREKMPMFYNFLEANWSDSSLSVLGLSSLSRDLIPTKPDVDFATDGPEQFGYYVTEEGTQCRDLTGLLNKLLS